MDSIHGSRRIAWALSALVATAAAAAAVAAPRVARADEGGHSFGLGLELGAPTGLAMKYYMGSSSGRGGPVAIQGGIGAIRSWGPDGIHIHADVVWHPAVLARTPDFTLPFYFGVGARILDWQGDYCYVDHGVEYCGGDGDTDIGVRVPFGLLLDFHKVPLDVFFELALVFDIIHVENNDPYNYHRDYFDLDGVIGVRYYF